MSPQSHTQTCCWETHVSLQRAAALAELFQLSNLTPDVPGAVFHVNYVGFYCWCCSAADGHHPHLIGKAPIRTRGHEIKSLIDRSEAGRRRRRSEMRLIQLI